MKNPTRIKLACAFLAASSPIPPLAAQQGGFGGATVLIAQSPPVATPFSEVTLSALVTPPAGQTLPDPSLIHYQWRRNGAAISGATQQLYLIPECTSVESGRYECDVSAGQATKRSSPMDLACAYPTECTVELTTSGVKIIGTAEDDDLEIALFPDELVVTVFATPTRPTKKIRFIGQETVRRPPRITCDLGDGIDILKCDMPADPNSTTPNPDPRPGRIIGGGQTGDTCILGNVAGIATFTTDLWEQVASTCVSGYITETEGIPLDHTLIQLSAITNPTLPVLECVTNSMGKFTAATMLDWVMVPGSEVAVAVAGSGHVIYSLGGGSLGGTGLTWIDTSYGVGTLEAIPPCLEFPIGMEPSLFLTLDELGSDGDGSPNPVCKNHAPPGGLPNALTTEIPDAIKGRVSNARYFNSSGSGTPGASYEVSDYSGLNPSTVGFSLNFWINRTAQRLGSGFPTSIIFLDHSDGFGTGWRVGWTDTANPDLSISAGHMFIDLGQGSFTRYLIGTPIPDGSWHLVGIAVDRSAGTVSFTIDGVAKPLFGSPPPAISPSLNFDNPLPLRIGAGPFIGSLDEIEMYKRVVTAAEMADLFGAGMSGHCTDRPFPALKRIAFFTEIALATAGATHLAIADVLRDESADADGDGVSNLIEFALGTNPLLASSVALPALGVPHTAGSLPTLTLTHPADRAVTLQAEFSSNFADWGTGELISQQVLPSGQVTDTWRAVSGTPETWSAHGFARLQATSQ